LACVPTSALSEARRNKYRMVDTVRAAGLRSADQLVTTGRRRGRRVGHRGDYWPCVAKPLASAVH